MRREEAEAMLREMLDERDRATAEYGRRFVNQERVEAFFWRYITRYIGVLDAMAGQDSAEGQ